MLAVGTRDCNESSSTFPANAECLSQSVGALGEVGNKWYGLSLLQASHPICRNHLALLHDDFYPALQLASKAPGAPLSHPGWMFSHLYPHAAEAYQGRTIHSERLNSRLANRSEVENHRCIGVPGKVLFP